MPDKQEDRDFSRTIEEKQQRKLTARQKAGKYIKIVAILLAMIESTALYCFVVSMILLFANPFWDYVISSAN